MARRVLALILLGLALIVCVVLAASESLTNRTGRTATAVTVTFTEQVRITSYDETVFPTREPSSRSETFRFSGGQLENGGRFSVSWTPSTAEITSTEWETAGAASSGSTASSTPLTYEQIMAQIARYPGPEEPLYVPAEGEQIWLTDLEGHADIYDNDSIKINYAPGFDKNQITKIEVYRNGVKMLSLPALFDVLTNDQMKTFDGARGEYSPPSDHTDHAIFGYAYTFKLYTTAAATPSAVQSAVIHSGIAENFRDRWFYVFPQWPRVLRDWQPSDSEILDYYRSLRAHGFSGVQLGAMWFIDGRTASTISPNYSGDVDVNDWLLTPTDEQLRRMLRLARDAGLAVYLRMELWTTNRSAQAEQYWRGEIEPSNLRRFFDSLGDAAVHYAAIADAESVQVFCPVVELDSLDQYTAEMKGLLNRVDPYFRGELAINASINHYLAEDVRYGQYTGPDLAYFSNRIGKYYDWVDDHGRPLRIDMSCWGPPIENQRDQRFSELVVNMVRFFGVAVDYLRALYPNSPISFGEIGTYNFDGVGMNIDLMSYPNKPSLIVDEQEYADVWAAYLASAVALGLQDVSVWGGSLIAYERKTAPGWGELPIGHPPLSTVIRAILLAD